MGTLAWECLDVGAIVHRGKRQRTSFPILS
jgi:hypothetical protein